MKNNNSKLWFRAKTYGWGWTPSTWQGWFLVLIYLIQVIGLSIVAEQLFQTITGVIVYIILVANSTIGLIVISYKTGEKPRWRWGKNT